VLRIPTYKDYTLSLQVPGSARLLLDGELKAEGSGTLNYAARLYKGDHALRVEAVVERPGAIQMTWDNTAIPDSAFLNFLLQGHGLIASFYPNASWQGEPKLVQLEPFVGVQIHSELDALGRPFTASWAGFLNVPVTGEYSFDLEAFETGELMIDGKPIPAAPDKVEVVQLEEGRHAIKVRLLNRLGGARVALYWRTPSSTEREIVPASQLSPR
jgi:hypothetical protein